MCVTGRCPNTFGRIADTVALQNLLKYNPGLICVAIKQLKAICKQLMNSTLFLQLATNAMPLNMCLMCFNTKGLKKCSAFFNTTAKQHCCQSLHDVTPVHNSDQEEKIRFYRFILNHS